MQLRQVRQYERLELRSHGLCSSECYTRGEEPNVRTRFQYGGCVSGPRPWRWNPAQRSRYSRLRSGLLTITSVRVLAQSTRHDPQLIGGSRVATPERCNQGWLASRRSSRPIVRDRRPGKGTREEPRRLTGRSVSSLSDRRRLGAVRAPWPSPSQLWLDESLFGIVVVACSHLDRDRDVEASISLYC